MTGRSSKSKTKKSPVETTLGQAPSSLEKLDDLSHLRKPIHTSVFGLKQVLSLVQTATTEVKDYISYECDILYECRICRTIFRSLANFILHKRNYCRDKFESVKSTPSDGGGFVVETNSDGESLPTTPEKSSEVGETSDSSSKSTDESCQKKTALPAVIDRLLEKQEVDKLAKSALNEDLAATALNKNDDDVVFVSEEKNLLLEKIETNQAAVFQTLSQVAPDVAQKRSLMKSEVMEIHGIFENNEVVLGSDGKVCDFSTGKGTPQKANIPKQKLICIECNSKFSTKKTLTHHIKTKHNKSCVVYPCPECEDHFVNAWGVFRHLYNVHRRSVEQVRKLRAQIHASAIVKDLEKMGKKKQQQEPLVTIKEDEENQWMTNFESDKDLQMCGGCGKRFERKAALQSHSQMCTKRIAICNNIKEKNKSADRGSKVIKIDKAAISEAPKGSAKRKASIRPPRKTPPAPSTKPNCDIKNDISPTIPDTENNIIISLPLKSESKEEVLPKETVIESDITIIKYQDDRKIGKIDNLPDIEIYSVSDDTSSSSSSSEPNEKAPMADLKDKLIINSNDLDIYLDTSSAAISLNNNLKRKRAASCDFNNDDVKPASLSDDADQSFFAKASQYINKDELKCLSCNRTYLSEYQLLWHMSLHFSWYRFQCSKCAFMSFNKYECTNHAYMRHGTSNKMMGGTVLAIPRWKVFLMAHDFKVLDENTLDIPTGNSFNYNSEYLAKAMPQLEIMVDDAGKDKVEEAVVVSDDEELKSEKIVKVAEVVKTINTRPVRNRTKSIKTVQNDFIYDLAKVLKLNDNSVKSSRLKRNSK